MGLYSHYILPKLINSACAMPQMMALRKRYVPLAKGRVLEIGIGSGLNLEFYSDATDSVTGLDPATELTEIAHQRAMKLGAVVELLTVSGETIPADTESFDTIVCTWTLCSIPNVYRALDEMRRVLKKDGRLIFIEHGRAPDPWVARVQNGLEPVWKRIGGGCHLTREIAALIEGAGFEILTLRHTYLPGPKAWGYMSVGKARNP